MSFSGDAWDETIPTNSNLANEIDDFMRDDKSAVRGRMALEHIWPANQSSTNQGGMHTFITFQPQTATPGLVYGTNIQAGALFISSSSKALTFVDSAGSSFTIVQSGVGVTSTIFNNTGTIGTIPYITSGGGLVQLVASASGYILTAQGASTAPAYVAPTFSLSAIKDYGTSASSSSSITQSNLKICYGTVSINGNSNATISNLPFASNTSYSFTATFGTATDATEACVAVQSSGSSVTIYNNDNQNQTIHWIAIGT